MSSEKKYIKYRRIHNDRCKLLDSEIKSIPKLHAEGMSINRISKKLGVGTKAVARWLKTPQERKDQARAVYEKYGKRYFKNTSKETLKERRDRCKKKKIKLLGDTHERD